MRLPRLYPILDTESLTARGIRLETAAAAFLEGGAGILQMRHKGHWGREIFDPAREVARLCRETGARSSSTIAPISPCCSAPACMSARTTCRRGMRAGCSGPTPLIGFSSHNADQLCAAGGEPVDYVALGPVFATGIQAQPGSGGGGAEVAGAAARWWKSRWWRSAASPGKRARRCWTAGADSVAVIGRPAARIALRPNPCGNGWKNGNSS